MSNLTYPRLEILIADSSPIWATTISEMLDGDRDLHVLKAVTDGQQAIEAAAELRPDLVILDVHLPVLGGLDAVSAIMARCPTPILMMTSDPGSRTAELTFEALRRGALDLIVKVTTYPPPLELVLDLRRRVKTLASIQVVRHLDPAHGKTPKLFSAKRSRRPRRLRAVGLVASTGGPAALSALLGHLPRDFPAGFALVQHLTSGFGPTFISWLDTVTDLQVDCAKEGDTLTPGRVSVAPDGHHLAIAKDGTLRFDDTPPRDGHRPSGDVLLESMARAYGPSSAGVVLTGMGRDGARGLAALHRTGGHTFAQDEASCVIFGMPRAAGDHNGVESFLPPIGIAEALIKLSQGPEKRSNP